MKTNRTGIFLAGSMALSMLFMSCTVPAADTFGSENENTAEAGWADPYRQILAQYMDGNASFYIADLDGGGVPELLLTDAVDESYHGGMVKIYTFDGSDAVDLGQYGSWNSIQMIREQGILLDTYLWEGGEGGTSYYKIDDADPDRMYFLFRVNQEIGEGGSFVRRLADKDGNDLPEYTQEDADDTIAAYPGTLVRYAVQDSLSTGDDPDAVIMLPVTEENVENVLGNDLETQEEDTCDGDITPENSTVDNETGESWQQAYWDFLMAILYDSSDEEDKAFCVDDMDGDGAPEIALADNNTAHYNGVTIYTWQNGQILELGGFGGNGGCEVCKDKGIIRGSHQGQGASITEYCQIDHSVPEGITLLCRLDSYTSQSGTTYDLVDADGSSMQSLTEDQYNSLIREYESAGTYTEYSVPDSNGENGYSACYPDWMPLYELTYDSICDATGIGAEEDYGEDEESYGSDSGEIDTSSLVWASDPLDIDEAIDIAYQNFYTDDCLMEKTGYGPTWEYFQEDLSQRAEGDATYSPDGIIFMKDGTYGVKDFSGRTLIDGLAGNYYWGEESDSSPIYYTWWGISLDEHAVLSQDYTTEYYNDDLELNDVFTGGDAGICYVNEDGKLRGAVMGDLQETAMDYPEWSEYGSTDAILLCVNEKTGLVTGSAKVNADGTVAYVTDYPIHHIDDSRGFVNGFYSVSFYQGPFDFETIYEDTDTAGYGMVDASTGQLITCRQYEDIKWFEDGYCPVKYNGRWGFIDEQGNEVTDFIFEDASALYDGKTYVMLDGVYRIMDLEATVEKKNGSVSAQEGADTVNDSGEDKWYSCTDQIFWRIAEEADPDEPDKKIKTLYLEGSGEIPDYDPDEGIDPPWFGEDFAKLEIYNGITGIGAKAFCASSELETFDLPKDSLTFIGREAFRDCSRLGTSKVLFLGNGSAYLSVSDGAFENCGSLQYLYLGENLDSLGDGCFGNCPDLKAIYGFHSTPAETFANRENLRFYSIDPEGPFQYSGFDLKKDGYSFANNAICFQYSTWLFTKTRIPLSSYQAVFGSSFTKDVYDQNKGTTLWDGNCSGMCATAVLCYKGRISLERFYRKGEDTLNKGAVDKTAKYTTGVYYNRLKKDSDLKKLIEEYQAWGASWDYAEFRLRNYFRYGHDSTNLAPYFSNILEEIQQRREPFLVSVEWQETLKDGSVKPQGHCMVVDSSRKPSKIITSDGNNGWYRIWLYDPNHPYYEFPDGKKGLSDFYDKAQERYIDINIENGQWKLSCSEKASDPASSLGYRDDGTKIDGTTVEFQNADYLPTDFSQAARFRPLE